MPHHQHTPHDHPDSDDRATPGRQPAPDLRPPRRAGRAVQPPPSPRPARHRRRLGAKHLVIAALLALLGSAGTFLSVTGNASASNTDSPSTSTTPPPSSPSVTSPTDNHAGHGGPDAADFVDIRSVRPGVQRPPNGRGASTGTFTSRCGRNENRHNNPDNFIVTPGVSNGAHHLHDYVGNLSTDAFSTDASLRAAGTTCARGDKSTYFWPVLRDRVTDDRSRSGDANANPDEKGDANPDGNGNANQGGNTTPDENGNTDPAGNAAPARQSSPDGNTGRALTARSVSLTFLGNPAGKVTAMPEGLRAITGDAKAFTNGAANARAQWTCTGFENRRLADKYPLCPGGSQVVRLLEFPSCWNGATTDSADHRSHLVFPDRNSGRCPGTTRAVPRLQMRLTYAVPARPLAFAVDSFPEQLRKPVTDHADFANFMPANLMATAVNCINTGRRCG
ncbi:DUF1996 domain-containing protein [Streptomyces sp. NPDC003077]|uniref:DUF1996 domain-containing protein n=1 Tax=Streptomyces sp. NPDC003077 TaxID=3154443 RepID=UPI0033B07319